MALFFSPTIALLAAIAPLAVANGILPTPRSIATGHCRNWSVARPLELGPAVDAGGGELLARRFHAFDIRAPIITRGPGDIHIRIERQMPPQAYTLDVTADGLRITAADDDGAFNAIATLAQLAQPIENGRWQFSCARITDRPAMQWRVLSDDVSRGPLPTMSYFRDRIATAAAYKFNGYSPYLEETFVSPAASLWAPHDGITASELTELAAYARRMHVTLIPEQQSFAHLHNMLRFERFTPLAEIPHGALMSPAVAGGDALLAQILRDELTAIKRTPFMHLGTDEPYELGRGLSADLIAHEGRAGAIADHLQRLLPTIQAAGARAMIWDDAVQAEPDLFRLLPHSIALVAWHYDDQTSDLPALKRTQVAGFDQFVAPGASNWNQFFPDLDHAFGNADRMIADGKSVGALGLFETVWNDDGETLFENTWAPIIEAAATAWQSHSMAHDDFLRAFAQSFFGDASIADDLRRLSYARRIVQATGDSDDYLFWLDPFDAQARKRVERSINLALLRRTVEPVIEHLVLTPSGPHHQTLLAMELAARRYDILARRFQIADEVGWHFNLAVSSAKKLGPDDMRVKRELYAARILLWEERDELLDLAERTHAAFLVEDRAGRDASLQAKYQRAVIRAVAHDNAIDRATREDYVHRHVLPPFSTIVNTN